MNDIGEWTHDSEALLARLVGSTTLPRSRSILVARYPDRHNVIWFAGLRAPIDTSEEAIERLVADGYLTWDESPRALRRMRITPAGLAHARGASYAQPAGD